MMPRYKVPPLPPAPLAPPPAPAGPPTRPPSTRHATNPRTIVKPPPAPPAEED